MLEIQNRTKANPRKLSNVGHEGWGVVVEGLVS